jgi:hypothetical protein
MADFQRNYSDINLGCKKRVSSGLVGEVLGGTNTSKIFMGEKRRLEQTGFVDVRVCRADESRIPDFNSYSLDVVEGKVRKPDSLFMEGIKL